MKSGFVNIIGNPNVGKSTLMNALVGERLSIITSKAQTTRKRVMGIVNGDNFQIVYTDTPGIVNPANKLHEQMMGYIGTALQDADLFLLVTEVGEPLKNKRLQEQIVKSKIPVLLIINKIDLSDQATVQEKRWEYDEQGYPTSYTLYDYTEEEPEMFVTLYMREYDAHGNWIRCTEYDMLGDRMIPTYTTIRNIEYF